MKRDLLLSITFALLLISPTSHAAFYQLSYTHTAQTIFDTIKTVHVALHKQKYEKVAVVAIAIVTAGGALAYFCWNWLKNKRPQQRAVDDQTKIILNQLDDIIAATKPKLSARVEGYDAIGAVAAQEEIRPEWATYAIEEDRAHRTIQETTIPLRDFLKEGQRNQLVNNIVNDIDVVDFDDNVIKIDNIHAVEPNYEHIQEIVQKAEVQEETQDELLESTCQSTNTSNFLALSFIRFAKHIFPQKCATHSAPKAGMKRAHNNTQVTSRKEIERVHNVRSDKVNDASSFNDATLEAEYNDFHKEQLQLRAKYKKYYENRLEKLAVAKESLYQEYIKQHSSSNERLAPENLKMLIKQIQELEPSLEKEQRDRLGKIRKIRNRLDALEPQLDRIKSLTSYTPLISEDQVRSILEVKHGSFHKQYQQGLCDRFDIYTASDTMRGNSNSIAAESHHLQTRYKQLHNKHRIKNNPTEEYTTTQTQLLADIKKIHDYLALLDPAALLNLLRRQYQVQYAIIKAYASGPHDIRSASYDTQRAKVRAARDTLDKDIIPSIQSIETRLGLELSV